MKRKTRAASIVCRQRRFISIPRPALGGGGGGDGDGDDRSRSAVPLLLLRKLRPVKFTERVARPFDARVRPPGRNSSPPIRARYPRT